MGIWRPNNIADIDQYLNPKLAVPLFQGLALGTQMAVVLKFTIAISTIFYYETRDKYDLQNYYIFIPLMCLTIILYIDFHLFTEAKTSLPEVEQGLVAQMNHEVDNREHNGLLAWSYRTYECCGIYNMPICNQSYPPFSECKFNSTACSLVSYPFPIEILNVFF